MEKFGELLDKTKKAFEETICEDAEDPYCLEIIERMLKEQVEHFVSNRIGHLRPKDLKAYYDEARARLRSKTRDKRSGPDSAA